MTNAVTPTITKFYRNNRELADEKMLKILDLFGVTIKRISGMYY